MALDRTADRLEQALLHLLAIPSVTGDEAAMADEFAAWAKRLGAWPAHQCRRMGNALIFGEPRDERPCLAFVGHLDTVPPAGGTFAPPTVREVDGDRELVGLGASDMKGGLAVMQVLLEQHAGCELPFDLVMILYDREEGPFADNGLEPVLAGCPFLRHIDLAVVMEPTSNRLELGCMGGLQARVQVHGTAAHSARPWQGVNAVHRAAPLLTALLARQPEDVDIDGLVFRNVVSATTAHGGRARNVVPDLFELNLNVRFAPSPNGLEMAKADLERLTSGHTLIIDDVSPAGPVPQNNALLAHWRSLCSLKVAPKQAWTDVARLSTYGIDAVNFGPGDGAQAHQAGEFVRLSALAASCEILMRLITTPVT